MPKVMTTLLYQYDELPTDKAKEAARDWYKQDRSYEFEIDTELGQRLTDAGVPDAQLHYSFAYVQGDGASFSLKERMDIYEFERQQRVVAESIKTKQWLHWEKFSTMGGDQVPEDLKVGEKVHIEHRYKHVNEKGEAIMNAKGGYSSYRAVWREGDPTPPGRTSIKQHSPTTILQIEKDQHGYIYIMRRISDDPISEAGLKRLHELQFNGLGTLQQLIEDEVDIVVNLNGRGRYFSTSVEIQTYSHGKRHDDAWQAAKVENQMPDGEWDKEVIDKLDAQVDELESEVDTNIDLFCRMFQSWVQSMDKTLERAGYDMIEAEESDENVAENIRINDHWFTANGLRSVSVEPTGI